MPTKFKIYKNDKKGPIFIINRIRVLRCLIFTLANVCCYIYKIEGRSKTLPKKIAYYINQFFGGIGGEDKANTSLIIKEGAVGPGIMLQNLMGGNHEIITTFVCGDNYFNSNREEVITQICSWIAQEHMDLLVAGPAFNAGRYGVACGAIAKAVSENTGIPVIVSMYNDNPAVDMYKRDIYIVPSPQNAGGMKKALESLAEVVVKLSEKGYLLSAEEDGYIPRGFRFNQIVEKTAASRAVEMLGYRLKGENFKTEIPVQKYEKIVPAEPVKDLSKACIALVTEAGIVPVGNPDKIRHANAVNWASYSLEGINSLSSGNYEGVHGGFDSSFAIKDPNRVLPVDALRYFEEIGYINKLHETYYVTVGNGTPVENCSEFGSQIIDELRKAGVQGVLVPST
jgi:betaine reductase